MIDHLRKNNITIVDYYIKDDIIEVLTNNGIITSKDHPELENMSFATLKKLKQEFLYIPDTAEEIVVKSAIQVRDKVNNSIQNLMQGIAQVRYKNIEITDGIINALESIEDKGIKDEIFCILKDKRDLHFELEKIVGANYTDVLTGCSNGNFFQRFLGKEDTMFNRHSDLDEYNLYLDMLNSKKTNSVMFCDLNNFKAINDLVSHGDGDKVLKNFADGVIAVAGEEVNLIRYGGDEFIVLGNRDVLNRLEDTINSPEFIEKMNSHVPKDIEFFGKPLVSTVSKGIVDVDIPESVACKDDVIDFKKIFAEKYHKADELSKLDKTKIKDAMGVGNYRPIQQDTQKEEYKAHLVEKKDSLVNGYISDKSADMAEGVETEQK